MSPRRAWDWASGNTLLWVLAAAMVAIGLVAFYTYNAYRSAATDLVIQRDGQVAQLSAARLQSEMSNFSEILTDIAKTTDMFSGDLPDQFRTFQAAAPRMAVFDAGVLLLDSRGIVIAAEPPRPELIGEDFSKREYYRALLRSSSVFISDAVADGPQGSNVIGVAVPIEGPQKELVGALVGFFEIGEAISSPFYSSLVRMRFGQTGDAYLFDGQARILFDSHPNRIGHFLTTAELTRILELRQAGALRTIDEEDNEIVAALAPVPNTDWTLVIEDDWQLLTSTTRRYSNMFFLSLGLGLLLPPISIAILTRRQRFRRLLSDQDNRPLELSSIVQHAIIPDSLPMLPGWELAVRQSKGETQHIGYYDASIMADGRLLLALGEVNTTSLPAALALTKTHAIMRAAAEQNSVSSEALGQCNRLLSQLEDKVSIRSIYLTLDPVDGSYRYCSAGQGPPIVADQLSTWQEWSDGPSHQLGQSLDPRFVNGRGQLEPGQILLLASQHALESEGSAGEVFFDEVVVDILEQPPDELARLANMLMAEYRGFQESVGSQWPPMTLLLLQWIKKNGLTDGANGLR